MSQGSINFSNGKFLSWDGSMPRYEVLYKFRKAIRKELKKSSMKDEKKEEDFIQYLPLKYIRKRKLKKINKSN
jgi:hypothetical protein